MNTAAGYPEPDFLVVVTDNRQQKLFKSLTINRSLLALSGDFLGITHTDVVNLMWLHTESKQECNVGNERISWRNCRVLLQVSQRPVEILPEPPGTRMTRLRGYR